MNAESRWRILREVTVILLITYCQGNGIDWTVTMQNDNTYNTLHIGFEGMMGLSNGNEFHAGTMVQRFSISGVGDLMALSISSPTKEILKSIKINVKSGEKIYTFVLIAPKVDQSSVRFLVSTCDIATVDSSVIFAGCLTKDSCSKIDFSIPKQAKGVCLLQITSKNIASVNILTNEDVQSLSMEQSTYFTEENPYNMLLCYHNNNTLEFKSIYTIPNMYCSTTMIKFMCITKDWIENYGLNLNTMSTNNYCQWDISPLTNRPTTTTTKTTTSSTTPKTPLITPPLFSSSISPSPSSLSTSHLSLASISLSSLLPSPISHSSTSLSSSSSPSSSSSSSASIKPSSSSSSSSVTLSWWWRSSSSSIGEYDDGVNQQGTTSTDVVDTAVTLNLTDTGRISTAQRSPATTDPTISAKNTINPTVKVSCLCRCSQPPKNLSQEELDTKLRQISSDLAIPRNSTSKYLRSKISMQDKRASSFYVGSALVFIITIPFGLIVLMDLIPIFKWVYSYLM